MEKITTITMTADLSIRCAVSALAYAPVRERGTGGNSVFGVVSPASATDVVARTRCVLE